MTLFGLQTGLVEEQEEGTNDKFTKWVINEYRSGRGRNYEEVFGKEEIEDEVTRWQSEMEVLKHGWKWNS